MKTFKMTLTNIPAELVSPIFQLLTPECNIDVEQEEMALSKKKSRPTHFTNGVRMKGISARDLILKSLADGPLTDAELEKIFMSWENPFSAKSVSPACNVLKKENIVKRNEAGKWELTRRR